MVYSPIFSLLIAVGSLLIGLAFIYLGQYLWKNGRNLRINGQTATATILRKFRQENQGALGQLENYYAWCSFHDAHGLPRKVEVKLQSKLWFQVSEGTTIQLTYIPNNLLETQFGSKLSWKIRGFLGLVIMGFGSLVILVITLDSIQELF